VSWPDVGRTRRAWKRVLATIDWELLLMLAVSIGMIGLGLLLAMP